MLDLKLLQKQPEVVAKALADRQSSVSVEEFKELDARRRAALTEVETLKAQLKKESGDVARLKRAGQDASELVARLGLLSDRIKELDQKADDIKEQLYQWMLRVPNIPDASVPVGVDENDNPELHRWGTPRDFGFVPKQHFEVGAAAAGLDFERGQARWLALLRLARGLRPAGARPDEFLPGHADRGIRGHGDHAPVHGQPRHHAGHGAAAQVRGRPL